MKKTYVAALIFSVLNISQAAELCAKDSEGNWKTTKGASCYMGQQQPGQPPSAQLAPAKTVAVTLAAVKADEVTVARGTVEAKQATPAKSWAVEVKDVTLNNTFMRWAEAAGQKVRWDAEKHVLVEAPNTLVGSFEEAVIAVLSSSGIADGAYPLEVCFYSNNPPLARITRKGEQEKECK